MQGEAVQLDTHVIVLVSLLPLWLPGIVIVQRSKQTKRSVKASSATR